MQLGGLHKPFVDTGYDDYEELLYLMGTQFPITDQVLEDDIGITKMGHR
jgi:hypothetical protein